MKVIERKSKGLHLVTTKTKPKAPAKKDEVIDFMSLLKQSMENKERQRKTK